MAHDVFISYSSKDKPIADGVCANLEAIGIRCWIAPRDIAPGEDWPTAIAKAISKSRIMVLVFSASSNSSEDVSRELILASNSKLVIIPFKIENIEPEPGKQYYLARTHWLDAMNPPTKGQITTLVNRVKSILPATEPVDTNQKEPDRELQPPLKENWFGNRKNMLLLGGLIALGLIAGIVFSTRYIGQIKVNAPASTAPSVAVSGCTASNDCPDAVRVTDLFGGNQTLEYNTEYKVSISPDQKVRIIIGWCAIDQKTLDDNLNNIKLVFTIDGASYFENVKKEYYTIPYSDDPTKQEYCYRMGGVASGWQDTHTYRVIAGLVFEKPVFDGWDSYPQEELLHVYSITADHNTLAATPLSANVPTLPSTIPSPTDTPEISTMPASGSQTEQARTFAGPVLTAISQRKPDFEDDFSKVNPDWFFDNMGGTSAIEDGVARFQISNVGSGGDGMSNDKALTGKDFVLQYDARLVSGDTTSEISVGLHNASETHKFWLFLHPAVKDWETGGVWGSNFFGILASGEDAVSPVGKITHITIITRGPRFALYLNQTPIGFFDNSNFDNAGRTRIACSSSTPAVCEFDNVKFWNLANIPGLP
jgi:hypothetical protein